MIVLSLFDYTGIMVEPWGESGATCVCVDIQHSDEPLPAILESGTVYKIGCSVSDIAQHLPSNFCPDIIFGFPPCTDLAVSGARWFSDKRASNPRFQDDAVALCRQVETLGNLYGVPWFAENPVSVLSTLWRKSNHWFHPWMFADLEPEDNYTKRTHIWCGNGFMMPAGLSEPIGVPDSRIHRAPPGPNRANFRSATPRGFAHAVFNANHAELK